VPAAEKMAGLQTVALRKVLPATLTVEASLKPHDQTKNGVALVYADLQALTFFRIFASHPSITSGFA
jgi:hypothetical protein